MLDLAVIEAGALELHFQPVRLADALQAAVERLHSKSPERRVDWNEQSAVVDVLADWSRLLQILDNLLANADRFGPPGTAIEVQDEAGRRGLVTVRVRDHGPGVASELRGRLFERFAHGPGEKGSAETAGTGLGLAIVRGLVEAHAGSVMLEEGGAGASFRFTLPRAGDEP
jgi:signal transduction histidine kinase